MNNSNCYNSISIVATSIGELHQSIDCGGSQISRTIIVDKSHKSHFTSLQAAIDSISPNNNKWVKIQINAGTYKEKVQIPENKPCIFIQGQGKDVTTIAFDDHVAPNSSSTFTSFSDNFVASDITFQNSFGLKMLKDLQNQKMSFDGIRVPALAARISGDKSAFFNCGFVGFQDTLWDELGRHYFQGCTIEGAVDFIFGDGQSYYRDCVLNVTALGSMTAQARMSDSEPTGFVFAGGSVIGSGTGISLLGRGYRPCSRVIFFKTNLGSVVQPVGWDAWSAKNNVSCLFYSEIMCSGPGSNTFQRVPWKKKLTFTQFAKKYSLQVFVNKDGWLSNLPHKTE
ncbi:probable pectinesterase 66 [Phaseolus vulgaris]|uniref:probable pectinesterase 66 n=1 Tax=Phaseolus vulgaris TaxID=3885 RepID=UPI0035CC5FBF